MNTNDFGIKVKYRLTMMVRNYHQIVTDHPSLNAATIYGTKQGCCIWQSGTSGIGRNGLMFSIDSIYN